MPANCARTPFPPRATTTHVLVLPETHTGAFPAWPKASRRALDAEIEVRILGGEQCEAHTQGVTGQGCNPRRRPRPQQAHAVSTAPGASGCARGKIS